jgi:PAS domain S-box-containing protein
VRKLWFGAGSIALFILLGLLVWQVSFTFGEYAPASVTQTFLFWAVSTLIFLLTVTLGFMLMRTAIKLYIERQSNREGSRIKTKLLAGALALTFLPVVFLVLFGYAILNRNIEKWFTRPAEGVKLNLVEAADGFHREIRDRAFAQAHWLASFPEARLAAQGDPGAIDLFQRLCPEKRIQALWIEQAGGGTVPICKPTAGAEASATARVAIPGTRSGAAGGQSSESFLVLTAGAALDLAQKQAEISDHVSKYDQLAANKRYFRNIYLLLLLLITLFVLFVATWGALFLARQISVPISALLGAAGEIRRGNLSYRVRTPAIDELATLVRGFNDMAQSLEDNSLELEQRRRFTEAILESIPTGVLSLSADGRILRVNRALRGIFPEEALVRAVRIDDLFSGDDLAEIRYLTKRARRVGVAASQIEYRSEKQVLHLAITVSALPVFSADGHEPGFVVVLEDTSELLRAQKAAAWNEVARRIAHELKNPLTPISLAAERMARILQRGPVTPESQRILRDCAAIIAREVQDVKNLADEFSRFSRFPAAQPAPHNLNDVVKNAVEVFESRLTGIQLMVDLDPALPLVNVDPEQIKRVIVNLVDNAAEAMQDSLVKRLYIATRALPPESVELLVADTGTGISAEDKERLFLPYFSTKGRGTGLGLAIVNHILSDHGASIRVEDNTPCGARFLVEIPALAERAVETRA